MNNVHGMVMFTEKDEPTDTREQILQAALEVLVKVGQAGFTTRRVAEQAGIAVGNLTYHYPNKKRLIQAMIGKLLGQYLNHFSSVLASRNEQDGLADLVNWLLCDALDETTGRIFRELWALALHDKDIANTLDDFYDRSLQRACDLLLQHYPKAVHTQISELLMLLAMIAEGCIVLYGTRSQRKVSHTQILRLTKRLENVLLAGEN